MPEMRLSSAISLFILDGRGKYHLNRLPTAAQIEMQRPPLVSLSDFPEPGGNVHEST